MKYTSTISLKQKYVLNRGIQYNVVLTDGNGFFHGVDIFEGVAHFICNIHALCIDLESHIQGIHMWSRFRAAV